MADDKEEVIESPDAHFEPVVKLPEVDVKSLEEDEEEMLRMRAKLFRYDTSGDEPEWKERGTGEVKLLSHTGKGTTRLLMRRDKTLKICANHYVLPQMELKKNCGSDKAWVWNTPADFADEEPKPELLAIRFANVENANKFKETFDRLKASGESEKTGDTPEKPEQSENSKEDSKLADGNTSASGDSTAANSVAEKLGEMSVKDSEKKTETTESKDSEKDTETAER
ncbi:ran-specific GTPase-activating protein [Lingula anatina]|uniref:Ran-specific GTPase-activating protein n=1 Tax=Lingula anatina TaxID=7574 RepID=A0A1S3IZX1_LINAN|nr:ran-specific GTPase-activating protein [Lingula anatina]|eukprot:XP_013403747.1 ran-specific GTPase-activating protein [Lingula anatina]